VAPSRGISRVPVEGRVWSSTSLILATRGSRPATLTVTKTREVELTLLASVAVTLKT